MDRFVEQEITETGPIIAPAEVNAGDQHPQEGVEPAVPSSIERLVGQRVNSELPNYKEVAEIMNSAFHAASVAGTKSSGEDGETIYTIAPSVRREIDGERYLFGLRAVCSSDAVFGEPNDFIAITWQHVTGMTVDMAEIREGALKVNIDGEESHVNEEADIAYVLDLVKEFAGGAQRAVEAKEAHKKRRVHLAKIAGAVTVAAVLVAIIPWGKVGSAISFDLSAPTEFDRQRLTVAGGAELKPAVAVRPQASDVLKGTDALSVYDMPYLNGAFAAKNGGDGWNSLHDDEFYFDDGLREVVFWKGNTFSKEAGESACEITSFSQNALGENVRVLTDNADDVEKLDVKLGRGNITTCWAGGEIPADKYVRVVFSQG